MISIDDDHPPSDPSSSHQEQHISHDLKVSDSDLKFSDAVLIDINNPLLNFSIRNYVFGIRSKDISCNWPFSPTSLQLCLKHGDGVKNLLPPFQSIDSLRNYSSLIRCSLENRLADEKLIKSFDGKPTNAQTNTTKKIALFVSETKKSSASKGDQESQFHFQRQTKLKEKDKPQKPENATSIHTINKKSRFVTKVSSGVEQIALNSETMTSKVCPVCKVFSSSSNTTLNAHIDQCLTLEGTMKWTENPKVVVRHKVKPRKMRLMMEIYKTAPHCTIEELDRRNGTSWATNSSFPAQEIQFQGEEEEEKEEPKKTTINPEAANSEGDVYIDTDGIKVWILSISKVRSSDNHKGGKFRKEVKRSKVIMGKKKTNNFKKKLSPNARKLCLPKLQARSGQEDDVAMKMADLGIIRPPWACSKRTGLSKKFCGENRKVELQCRETKELIVESEKSSSRCELGTPQSVKPNKLHDVESVRNEKLLSNVVPAPTFMDLSTSFGQEFSKQECGELYQDQICSTNPASNDVEIHESYCHEVDPIPTPGPPGSFLPASPGGEMISEEEIQPVTVFSSENQTQHHLDHTIDRYSISNSPVSTISNSRSSSVQDDTCKKPFFSGDSGFITEKGSSPNSFKSDHQPCCCSRKEVGSNYQDSFILRKQHFNFKSEMFPSSNYPTLPAPETASFPTHKKFPVSSDCNSPAGSPSKPVLRLMGKNLTVVQTDDDEFRPPQSSQQHPQQPVIFSQYQNGFQSQHFNIHPPINMRSPFDLMPFHGGFMGSVDRYGYGGPYLGPSMPQTRSRHGHNVLDFQTISGRNFYTAASSSKPINEIIIIDDSPESEADDSMQNDFFKRNQRQMTPSYTLYPSYGGSCGSDGSSMGNEDFGKGNIRSPSVSHLRSSTSYYLPNYL